MKQKCIQIWILLVCLWISASGGKPARAYEGDHYVWTYYLARHCGYTHRQAFQIASAAYAIDWDPNTGPMPEGVTQWGRIAAGMPTVHQRKWTEFHAFTLNQLQLGPAQIAKNQAAERLWRLAVEQRNPGPYIHFIQDVHAHSGWDDVRGHGFAGHLPDFLSHDYPDHRRAKAMTQDTIAALLKFRKEVMGITTPIAINAQIWVDLENLIRANPLPVSLNEPFTQANVFDNFYVPRGIKKTEQGIEVLAGGDPVIVLLSRLGLAKDIYDVILAQPVLETSLAAINGTMQKAYQTGRFKKFPHANFLSHDSQIGQGLIGQEKTVISPVLPRDWKQYAFSPEGRATEDGTFAVENLQLQVAEPTVQVEIPKPDRGVRKVTAEFVYQLKGVVPTLSSLPVVDWIELEFSLPRDLDKNPQRRHLHWVAEQTFEGRVRLSADVPKEDCERNRVKLKFGVQVAGMEPQWQQHQLVTAPNVPTSQDKMARLQQAVSQAGFGRVTDTRPNMFQAFAFEKGSNNGSYVAVTQWESEEKAQAFLRSYVPPSQFDGPESRFGSSVTVQKRKITNYFRSPSDLDSSKWVITGGGVRYGIVLDKRFNIIFHSSFWAPEPTDSAAQISLYEKTAQDARDFGEPTMRRLVAALVALGASSGPGYKWKRLPDPVFADSAPLLKSNTTSKTPRVATKTVPKLTPKPKVPPRTGTKAGKIPLPPMPKQDKYLPPLGSVSNVVAENFGTYARIQEGKLVLTDVVRGSRGEDVGLSSGDRILQIGDKNLEGVAAVELQALAHAPLRAPLTVTFVRGRDQAKVVVMFLERTAGYTMIVTVLPK